MASEFTNQNETTSQINLYLGTQWHHADVILSDLFFTPNILGISKLSFKQSISKKCIFIQFFFSNSIVFIFIALSAI